VSFTEDTDQRAGISEEDVMALADESGTLLGSEIQSDFFEVVTSMAFCISGE